MTWSPMSQAHKNDCEIETLETRPSILMKIKFNLFKVLVNYAFRNFRDLFKVWKKYQIGQK